MKTTAYLSSARTVSLIVVATLIVGTDLTRNYARRMTSLVAAREAFVEEAVRQFLGLADGATQEALDAALRTAEVRLVEPGNADWNAVTWTAIPGSAIGVMEIHQSSSGFFDAGEQRSNPNELLIVVSRPPRQWAVHVAEGVMLRALAGANKEKPIDTLRRTARELDISVPDAWDYAAVFRAIEHEIIEKEVALQSLGIAFRPDFGPWVIAVVTLGLVLMIRNQVTAVVRAADDGRDEPWLLIDPCEGLERLVAGLWLAAIVVAPWAASATVFFMEAERAVVDGAITSGARDITVGSGAVTILILSAWASISTAAAVLALRRRRATAATPEIMPVTS